MIKHKHGNCPQCGGPLRAETLGWRCENCRGFIDMIGGKFYAYEEKPFLPPMTNGDRIRAMSDEELAEWMAECNAFGENAEATVAVAQKASGGGKNEPR